MHVTLWLTPKLSVAYASYHLNGLLELARDGVIGLSVRAGSPPWIGTDDLDLSLAPFNVLLDVDSSGRRSRLAFSLHDSFSDVDTRLMRRVDWMYKVNYNPSWIAANLPPEDATRLRPLGAFFGLPLPLFAESLPYCRWDFRCVPRMVQEWRRSRGGRLSIAQMRRLRTTPATTDVFFVGTNWGDSGTERRCELVQRLKKLRVRFYGGLVNSGKYSLPPDCALAGGPLSHHEYCRAMAASKVVIDTVGAHFCLSWKLPEKLALGSFVISERLVNTLPYPLGHREHIVFLDEQMSDLEALILEYLENDTARLRIAAAGAQLFDDLVAPARTCERILREV